MSITPLWPIFAVLAVLLVMVGVIVVGSVSAPPETLKVMIDGQIISRGIVLFLVIPTIAILCIQDRISGEAAVAILSSIAGYILGGVASS